MLCGTEVPIDTLALVVPDWHSKNQSQMLIGTNTLDFLMYSQIKSLKPSQAPYGYMDVLKPLDLREKQLTIRNW